MEPQWIDTSEALAGLVNVLRDEPRYALDTEFHGERTYWPRLALVQVAWPEGIALIDPLAVDMAPFGEILRGPGVMIAHAAEQDLAILVRACGAPPTKLFDTQIAAGFIGMGAPSLASLGERLLGVKLAKGDRLTDWTRRPLKEEQKVYAAADVEHLLALHDVLVERLEPMGRLDWATDECEERRSRIRTRPEPELAWWRMKGARQLRGKSRGVAQQVGAWRERAAAELDVPPRFVLSDLALIGIVSRPPRTREELSAIRGVDGRSLRDGAAQALLDAITAGLALEPSSVEVPESDHVDRALAPAVTVIGAWLSQRASELDLDPAVLATRADLNQLFHGAPSRLATGWRAELVGAPIKRLLAGESTIVLRDGGRRVELRDLQPALMAKFKVGVQLHPQATTTDDLRAAWKAADALEVDSIWVWDHFYPLYGDPDAAHFEAYSLLAAMAVETSHTQIGALVTCNSYRNPELLADMSRTIDHLSGGRFTLGIGSGWFERDYTEYGYEFGTAPGRLRDLAAALPRIMERFDKLTPPPKGRLPILIGGSGPKVTLRLTAEHADGWNSFGPPASYAEKNRTLDEWCAKLERNPRQIERTVGIQATEIGDWQAYLEAGAEHIIVMTGPPFDLDPTRKLLESARA